MNDNKGLWLRAALLLLAVVVAVVSASIILYRIFSDTNNSDFEKSVDIDENDTTEFDEDANDDQKHETDIEDDIERKERTEQI